MGKLTVLSAKVLSTPGRHGDGEGLYLNIAPWHQVMGAEDCS